MKENTIRNHDIWTDYISSSFEGFGFPRFSNRDPRYIREKDFFSNGIEVRDWNRVVEKFGIFQIRSRIGVKYIKVQSQIKFGGPDPPFTPQDYYENSE